jgi:MIP family channel proteins
MNRAYYAEALATFCLVFAGTGAIVINEATSAITHVGIALTFGLIVMAMIYAFGEISGAHMNPAVTIAFWALKRFAGRDVAPYILCQLLGACAASAVMKMLFPESERLGSTVPAGSWQQSFILEFILTAMLMLVVCCVSSGSKETGIMAGAAIGAVIALEAMFAGPICGASMNPARSLAPALLSQTWTHQWIYVAATIGGALCGALAFQPLRRPAETAPTQAEA